MLKWQKELRGSIRTLDELLKIIPLTSEEQKQLAAVLECSPMLITPYYLSLIDFEDENDPIRKIAVPSLLEADTEGSLDTSGETKNTVLPGLQHKYQETALMLTNALCATYCRHCFRKRLVGLPDEDSVRDLDAVHAYLLDHPEIVNVLVSGGDAFLNSNEYLDNILEMLTSIPHLDYLRLATRTPVTLPVRISGDKELLSLLARHNKRKKLYLVTQFNHPREVTSEAIESVKSLHDLGISVRNQTVLLQGINDDARVLGSLLRSMVSIGVDPYYVFQCRPVKGVKNVFQVPLLRGYEIVEEAKGMQSGLSKSFRFCLSHLRGKIEILSRLNEDTMLFKYHEAQDRALLGTLFTQTLAEDQAWLD